MNLVQIQERLKDAPVQAIMQYANGQNPMVPPYLALAELKRRESINQSAQAQQAMQQGQQPSVKEQIEQAAGLAGLQQQMQQQGMQNLMQQARPQGIPENIPQPQRQPEMEGIAGLPAGDFNFADGGIVAFQGGGSTYDAAKARLNAARNKLNQYGLKLQKSDPQGFEAAKQELADAERAFAQAKISWESETAGLDRPIAGREDIGAASRFVQQQPVDSGYATKEAARATTVAQQPAGIPASMPPQAQPAGIPPAQQMQGPLPAPGGIAGGLELPQRRAGVMPQGTPEAATPAQSVPPIPQAVPQAGIAALPGAEQANRIIAEQMQKQPTPESAYEVERKMAGLYGLTQPAGEERMQRIAQMEAERKRMLEDRGMERLMRVMGGIAGRGLQGAGPAYLAAIEGERGADVAFRKQMNELLSGVEEKRRAEQVAGMQRATGQMGDQEKLRIGAAEKIFDAQRRREEEELKQRWEVQKSRMMPNEAQMMQQLIDDIMRRNPGMPFSEAYGKAMELKQGLTPEIKREQLHARAYNEAAKMWEDMLVKPKDITREQWISREVENRLRGSARPSSDIRSKADAILAGGR